jgi:RNA-directed DNA polymerase
VEIPKPGGKKRPLGIPTVSDRIAPQVVKTYLEPRLEVEFLENSYGYRPLLAAVKQRLTDCGLTAHPEKTKIVYCKKSGRNLKGYPVQFDFLGFSFRPIRMKLKKGGSFLQFDCIMSRKFKVRITGELRKLDFHNKTQRTIQDLAILLNPKIRGWLNYYGKINRRCLRPVFYYLHHRMI